ncbi:hypothetical protein EXIGLDRAFT_573919, partial [Exidia glandulosa HHB12029]
MCPKLSFFKPSTFVMFDTPKRVRFGDDSYAEAHGCGQLVFRSVVNGEGYELTISGVLYVPSFKLTLISVSSLDKRGY